MKSQQTIARRQEKKALKKLERQKQKENKTLNGNPIQEIHPEEIGPEGIDTEEPEIKLEDQLEENYWKQEFVPYYPITHIEVPPLVMETGQRIKSLPGCIAKRTYIYGGTARDAALRLKRNKFDYDIRTGLPLSEVAPLLKSVFQLEAAPDIKFNLLTVNYVVNTAEGAQHAVLTVHHSEHLAKEELSFLEVLRIDALTLDFIQNVFIATFPRTRSRCAVHYPLNWWQFYLAPTLNEAEENVKRSKTKEHLSESLTTITNPPFLLVTNKDTLKAYLFIYRSKHCFDLKLKKSDHDLLVTNKEGRLTITTQNQRLVLKFLKQLNKQYNKIYPQEKLHDLTKNIVDKMSRLNKLETILEPKLSLTIDPLRILRLVYLTSSLNCESFSDTMISAVINHQESYKKFLLENPGRINSWMNKLLCRDGKHHIIENFNHLIQLKVLEISFPDLTEALCTKILFQWVNNELYNMKQRERPSLNYLYCVLIHCLSLHKKTTPEQIIEATPLFKENFKSMPPLDLLRSIKQSWYASQQSLHQADFFNRPAHPLRSVACPRNPDGALQASLLSK